MPGAKVGVVIPCRDVKPLWLEKCMSSLADQTFQDFRVMIVGDHIQPISAAVNKGVELCDTPLVTILSSNDWVEPTWLEVLVGLLDSHPECEYAVPNTGKELSPDIFQHNYLPYAAVFRRSLWDRIGGYLQHPDGLVGLEDWYLWIRISTHAIKGCHTPEKLLNWREHDGLTSRADRYKLGKWFLTSLP